MSVLKIAVVTGGHHYEVQPFARLFRSLPGVDAYIQHMEDFTGSTDEVRDGYDVIVFYTMLVQGPTDDTAPGFSARPRAVLSRLGESSQGIVLLHHSILAYPDWPVWDEMVGMTSRKVARYDHEMRIPVEIANPDHPIVQGITPWALLDETYVMPEPGEGNQILLTTRHPRSMRSLAWTRAYRNGRIFCYQSGHDHHTFEDATFRAVLANGIRWTARRS